MIFYFGSPEYDPDQLSLSVTGRDGPQISKLNAIPVTLKSFREYVN